MPELLGELAEVLRKHIIRWLDMPSKEQAAAAIKAAVAEVEEKVKSETQEILAIYQADIAAQVGAVQTNLGVAIEALNAKIRELELRLAAPLDISAELALISALGDSVSRISDTLVPVLPPAPPAPPVEEPPVEEEAPLPTEPLEPIEPNEI